MEYNNSSRRRIGFFNTKNSNKNNFKKKCKQNNSIDKIEIGSLYFIDLGNDRGFKINGKRPCLIIRQVGETFVVLPLSKFRKKLHVSEVLIRKNQGNLKFDSIVKIGQIQTVNNTQILQKTGEVSVPVLEIVAKKLQNFYIHKLMIEIAKKEIRA